MAGRKWYPHAQRVPSGRLNPMNGRHKTRRAVFHYSEGGGTAEWLAHYVNGNRGEYHAAIDQDGHVAQMVPFTSGSRALLNGGIDGGDGCNRTGTRCIQIALVGYTKSSKSTLRPGGKQWVALHKLAVWLKKHHGIPLQHVGHRDRGSAHYIATSGWYSHREAPGNDHTDEPWTWDWLKAHHNKKPHPQHEAHHKPHHKPQNAHHGHQEAHTLYVVTVEHGGREMPILHRDGGGFTLHADHAKHHPHGHMQHDAVAKAKHWARHHDHPIKRVLKATEFHDGDLRLASGQHWPTDKRTVDRLKAVAADLGRPLVIVSGLRLTGHPGDLARGHKGTQYYLYEGWSRRLRGFNLAARPGTSEHEFGHAADVDVVKPDGSLVSLGDYPGGYKSARKHGLHFTATGEAWHISPEGPDRWHP